MVVGGKKIEADLRVLEKEYAREEKAVVVVDGASRPNGHSAANGNSATNGAGKTSAIGFEEVMSGIHKTLSCFTLTSTPTRRHHEQSIAVLRRKRSSQRRRLPLNQNDITLDHDNPLNPFPKRRPRLLVATNRSPHGNPLLRSKLQPPRILRSHDLLLPHQSAPTRPPPATQREPEMETPLHGRRHPHRIQLEKEH